MLIITLCSLLMIILYLLHILSFLRWPFFIAIDLRMRILLLLLVMVHIIIWITVVTILIWMSGSLGSTWVCWLACSFEVCIWICTFLGIFGLQIGLRHICGQVISIQLLLMIVLSAILLIDVWPVLLALLVPIILVFRLFHAVLQFVSYTQQSWLSKNSNNLNQWLSIYNYKLFANDLQLNILKSLSPIYIEIY